MLSHRTGEDDADRPPYGGAGADDEGVSVASSLTLDQVEQPWPPPPDSATDLVRRCHRLRRVPVGELTTEGLRVLLGQQIGVPTLLPLAVARLVDPLAAGDYQVATAAADGAVGGPARGRGLPRRPAPGSQTIRRSPGGIADGSKPSSSVAVVIAYRSVMPPTYVTTSRTSRSGSPVTTPGGSRPGCSVK